MANENNISIQETGNLNHKHPLLNMSPDSFNLEEGRGCCPSERFATAATAATITCMLSAGIGFFCCGANAAVTGMTAAAGTIVGSLVGAGCTEEINTCGSRCERRMAPY